MPSFTRESSAGCTCVKPGHQGNCTGFSADQLRRRVSGSTCCSRSTWDYAGSSLIINATTQLHGTTVVSAARYEGTINGQGVNLTRQRHGLRSHLPNRQPSFPLSISRNQTQRQNSPAGTRTLETSRRTLTSVLFWQPRPRPPQSRRRLTGRKPAGYSLTTSDRYRLALDIQRGKVISAFLRRGPYSRTGIH